MTDNGRPAPCTLAVSGDASTMARPRMPRNARRLFIRRGLSQHRLRDSRELLAHVRVRLHRRGPYDDAVRTRVQQSLDELAVARLAMDRDRNALGIASGFLRERVERRAALAHALGRDGARREPAVTPRDDALQDVLRAPAEQHRWVRLLRRLRIGF